MEPILRVEDVSFRYGQAWVLRDISFAVRHGEIWGIMGPNASGKTTLLHLLNGILHPQKGAVFLEGRDISGMRRRQIARQMGVVSQDTTLFYSFQALEMVLMGRTAHLPLLGFEGPKDLDIARRSLERTGCAHLSNRYVTELSGGERQRVLIARALAQEPSVLLLDEPTSQLDLRYQLEFLDLLLRLHEDEGMALIWVSHDINLAAMACRRLLLLRNGRIHALGPPEEVVTADNIETVYGHPVMVDRNPQMGTPRVTPLVDTRTAGERRGESR